MTDLSWPRRPLTHRLERAERQLDRSCVSVHFDRHVGHFVFPPPPTPPTPPSNKPYTHPRILSPSASSFAHPAIRDSVVCILMSLPRFWLPVPHSFRHFASARVRVLARRFGRSISNSLTSCPLARFSYKRMPFLTLPQFLCACHTFSVFDLRIGHLRTNSAHQLVNFDLVSSSFFSSLTHLQHPRD